MPTTKIEGVVSDFAQPGAAGDHAELTIGDMEQFIEKLRNMRLTFDHEHPIHSTEKRKITEQMTVGKITDAYIDDSDCLRVVAELDDNVAGEEMCKAIENKFLNGFSLGLLHKLTDAGNGKSKFNKELVELSITAQPEFAETSFVRFVDGDAAVRPVHCKMGDVAKLSAEKNGTVVAITASSGKRDARTERRARELLAEIRTAELTNAEKYSSGAPSSTAQQQNQRNMQKQPTSLVETHMDSARARHNSDVDDAFENGPRFQQRMPRNGVAPIHIHNYVDGTRRGQAQQQQMLQQQRAQEAQQMQMQKRRRMPAAQQYGDEDEDDEAAGYYDDGEQDNGNQGYSGYDDTEEQIIPPPRRKQPQKNRQMAPPPQRRQQPPPSSQLQRKKQPVQPRRRIQFDNDEMPLPSPEEEVESEARPWEGSAKGGTKSRQEMREIEKKRRDAFKLAGGQISDNEDDGDDSPAPNSMSKDETEAAEFEAFKQYRAMKSGVAPPARQNKRSAQASQSNVARNNDNDDNDNDVDDKVATRRFETGAKKQKNDAMKKSISSLKTKLDKDAPLTLEDEDEFNGRMDEDDVDTAGGENNEEFEAKAKSLNELLKVDEQGQSAFASEFFATLDELKSRRQEILSLKRQIFDIKKDPSKKALADKLLKKSRDMDAAYAKDSKKAVDDALEFTSKVNMIHKRPTDGRTLETFSEMKHRRGLMVDSDLNALGVLVQTVSASSGELGKTLQSVTDRFKREAIEREKAEIRLREAKQLLGANADSEAAKRFIQNNDPLSRNSSTSSTEKKKAYIVETQDRKAQSASANYSGYDPQTMLPMGVAREDFTKLEETGIPYKFVDDTKPVEENTRLKYAFRQKAPKIAFQLPNDLFPVSAKKGLFRTGNRELINAVSASRREGGEPLVTKQTFRRLTQHAPRGAVLSPDQAYFVLPTAGQ